MHILPGLTSWPLPRTLNFLAAFIKAGKPRSDINLSSGPSPTGI